MKKPRDRNHAASDIRYKQTSALLIVFTGGAGLASRFTGFLGGTSSY